MDLHSDLLNEENEAWLIKVPNEFSVENLKGQKLKLHKRTKFTIDDSTFTCSAIPKMSASFLDRFSIVVPCEDREKFTLAPINLKGEISIIADNKTLLPPIQFEDLDEGIRASLPTGLHQRILPFGAESPKKRKLHDESEKQSTKNKKRKRDKNDSPIEKKRKKKHFYCNTTNDLSDDE